MEPKKNDTPKLPDMVMCGDHPSVTKTELNAKEVKPEVKEKDKNKDKIMSYARISPTSSRTERDPSEHALRLAAHKRARSLDVLQRAELDPTSPPNRALLQAALGSFRWPPYLLCVWVVVLVLTHALHCLAGLLDAALPPLKKFCQYFRTWTEESWKTERELNHRVYPIGLACLTGLLYIVYFGLYVVHSVALWAIEPLCGDLEDKLSAPDQEPKVTDYIDDANNKSDSSVKR